MGKNPLHLCAVFALSASISACNIPGENNSLTFANTASATTPSLSGPGSSGSAPNPLPVPSTSDPIPNPSPSSNVLAIELGGTGVCGTYGSVNQPCASVTICVPGTSTCQTITNVLVDTGSYGLRLFSSTVSLSLPQLTDTTGRALAECAQFGTGADWGPVMQADVQLAQETEVAMPIQVINSAYEGGPPTVAVDDGCTDIDTSPQEAGFNGILGVGLFTQDCGSDCVDDSSNGLYFGCSGTCSGASVALANQVVNPVSMMLQDNNGLLFDLGSVLASGGSSMAGTVTFGVGTETDNAPSGVKTYFADPSDGDLTTTFNGESYPASFLDSGSNGLFFPAPSSLPSCGENTVAPGWFCPDSTGTAPYYVTPFSASNASYEDGTPVPVGFSIANAVALFDSGNIAFNDLGASSSDSGFTNSFDWGLPFFFGRPVFVGVDGARSTLGTGPYWAY